VSFRSFLLSSTLSCLAFALAAGPATGRSKAPALEMSRKDRLAVLYSNQVIFDRSGEPLVSVRVTEGQAQVRFRSGGPLTMLPAADDGARVRAPAGTGWTVTVEDARRGREQFWVVVERLPAGELAAAAASRKRWQDEGHKVAVFEGGALIGIAGRTLDTRSLSIVVDPKPTRAEAEAAAEALEAKVSILGEVVAESVERPGGWIVAREDKSGVEVRARDLLWLSPAEGQTIDVADVEFGRGTARPGKADRRYAGDLYLALGNDGLLAVVNVASAETLLEGTVPSEIPASSPEAALEAQAIAARGQLLAKVGTRHRSDPYLLCADTHCQVYGGETKAHARTTAAVRATRGLLLFDDRGLVDTVYSSNCGGHSEAFQRMWGGTRNPTLEGVVDAPPGAATPSPVGPDEAAVAHHIDHPPTGAYCAVTGRERGVFRWRVTRTGAEVDAAVNRLHAVGEVHSLRVVERGRSGRALAVEYVGTTGRHTVTGEYANRKLLGHLKSGLWVVERDGVPGRAPATWTFRGGGFGHGVGMCQHGAIGQALERRPHAEILRTYYPGSRLEKAW
jgi:SpoIID/LytB domain protein